MDRLYIPVITLQSINCCGKTFYCNDHTITEFGITDNKNSSTEYVILYELIDTWFLDSNRRVGVWSLPCSLAHPLHPIDNRSRNKRRNLWVGWCVSSWWPWFPSRSSVLIYIYIYMHSLYEFCYKMYIYTKGVSFSIGEAAPHHVL